MPRGRGLGAATLVVTVLLATTGCDLTLPITGPSTAPSVATSAPATEALALAGLKAMPDARTVTSIQRPNEGGVASYLLVQTTSPLTALAFCDQLSGVRPVRERPLTDEERSLFGLEEDPPGELGTCTGITKGEQYGVQRDVLVAVTGDTATVWLSAFEMLR